MKNTINFYSLYRFLPMGLLLLGMSACTTSRTVVGETDGIYYDPKEDSEVIYTETVTDDTYYQNNTEEKENLVRIGGKYFDKEGNTPYNNAHEKKSEYVEEYSNDYFNRKNNSYATWGDDRENVNVNFNYYGNPYYSGFGWGIGYSWGDPFYWDYGFSPYGYWNPYNRFNNYYGYGWGNPYNYWNPYWGSYYGNPYWRYYGNPYYGGGYYDPYVYYNGRNVQRAQRGKGMNSNVTINRGSSNSGSQRMGRIRRRGNNDYNPSNNQSYIRGNSSNTGYRNSRSSDYGTRRGQRIRRESPNRSSSRSYSSPQRSSSNWGSSSSSSRGSSWSGSSSTSSSRSGQRIRR